MKNLYTFLAASLITFGTIGQTRLPLVEGFTSSTCGPCASFNAQYQPILDNNDANDPATAGVAVVKYQMDWPSPGNDPSYNAEGESRRGFYGVTGIPDWFLDGQSQNGTQGDIDAAAQVPAEIAIEAAYTLTGTTIDVDVEVTPSSNLGNGNRLYMAIMNAQYNYNGANGETSFQHVMRKMLPGAGGSWMPNLEADSTYSFSESYTYTVASGNPAQGSFEFWDNNFEIVVWVQDPISTKEVYNAKIVSEGYLGVDEGDDDDFGLIAYPNPANEEINLMFDAQDDDAIIEIYGMNGELVEKRVISNPIGRQKISIDADGFAPGLYSVRVTTGDKIAVQRVSIL